MARAKTQEAGGFRERGDRLAGPARALPIADYPAVQATQLLLPGDPHHHQEQALLAGLHTKRYQVYSIKLNG